MPGNHPEMQRNKSCYLAGHRRRRKPEACLLDKHIFAWSCDRLMSSVLSGKEDQPCNASARTIIRALTTNDTSGDQADQTSTSSTVAFRSTIQLRTRKGPTKHTRRLLRRPTQRIEAATTDSWIYRWYGTHQAPVITAFEQHERR
jgi:hypothetical protein